MENDQETNIETAAPKQIFSQFSKRVFKLGYFMVSRAGKVSGAMGYAVSIIELLQITSICFSSKVFFKQI